jgi:hypothetical protein
VVNDIQVACAKWTEVFGAGPFFLMDHVKFDDTTYRGENVPVELSYAFGQAGPAHIQLIQQHDDAPSVYRDFYKKGEEGFHHWAILVPDFDAEKKRCEEFGYEPVTELVATGHVAYMDARKDLGGFIELYEDNPNVRQFFQLLEDSHKDWDGKTDAVRSAFG